MKRKILSIGTIILLVFTMVPIRETDAEKAQKTQVDIEIYGGFGLTIIIKNLEEANLSDLDVKIDLSGSIIVATSRGGNISLPGGESAVIIRIFLLGNGPGKIEVTVEDVSKTANLFIIGPFVIIERAIQIY